MYLPFDPAFRLLGIYSEDNNTKIHMHIAALFVIEKYWKQIKYPYTGSCSINCGNPENSVRNNSL